MPNRYVYAIKHETRGHIGLVLYSVYVPYLGMLYVICVTGMQFMVAMYTDKRVVLHLLDKHQLAGTLYNIKCVAALLIHPRKVTQIYIRMHICTTVVQLLF